MAENVLLGEVTCPSGELVLLDGGYLGMWANVADRVTDEDAPAAVIAGLPTDRALPVTATPHGDWGWAEIQILVNDGPVAETRELGTVVVDYARFAIADRAALASWVHDDSLDGLADVVFWGRDEVELAAELGATRTNVPGDNVSGWLNLPVAEAYAKAVALDARRGAEPQRMFAFDLRPHSHHWQVMARVRASEHEAATIEVGGAHILFAMTSVGDGFFPVQLDLAADGTMLAIRITVRSDDDESNVDDVNG